MGHLRALFLARVWLAAAVIAAALVLRAVVPGGFMPVLAPDGTSITVAVCNGMGADSVRIEIPGTGNDSEEPAADQPCAFTGFAQPLLGGADPIQLALAILAIVALGLLPIVRPAPAEAAHRRPPSRAPPFLA